MKLACFRLLELDKFSIEIEQSERKKKLSARAKEIKERST
jgi:hypothetical protein